MSTGTRRVTVKVTPPTIRPDGLSIVDCRLSISDIFSGHTIEMKQEEIHWTCVVVAQFSQAAKHNTSALGPPQRHRLFIGTATSPARNKTTASIFLTVSDILVVTEQNLLPDMGCSRLC
jgi:hypothetical protein